MEQYTVDAYIETRLREQQSYFSAKSAACKRKFRLYQTVVIVLGAIIPILVLLDQSKIIPNIWCGILTALMSAGISIIAGLEKISQPQTEWINYRRTGEMLKQEEALYRYEAGPYDNLPEDKKNKLFVQRIENIISNDVNNFVQSKTDNGITK